MTNLPSNTDDIQPSNDGVFLCARFAGGRFDSHAIPFDVLPDLAAYRNLIIDVAKMLFKKKHDNRARVPKGFEDSFQIGLVQIQGGKSAVAVARRIPVIELAPQFQGDFGFSTYQEFDEARDYVDELIRQVGTTGNVPSDFPTELAGRFNPFGQSLQSDEFVELSHDAKIPVRYDTFIRKKIVLSREQTYENSVNQLFTLNGGVYDAGTIHVRDEAGVPFDFRPLTGSEFEKAFARTSHRVHLVGTGLYDRHEKLRRILDVNIIYNDDQPRQSFDDRLDEIAQAKIGWYQEDNPAPSISAVESMRRFVGLAVNEVAVPGPYLYPLPDGGVAAEWTQGDWEVSLNVTSNGNAFSLHAINAVSMKEIDDNISSDAVDLITRFSAFWAKISVDEGGV